MRKYLYLDKIKHRNHIKQSRRYRAMMKRRATRLGFGGRAK